MYFVYILKSLANPKKYYIGITKDLDKRILEHNSGDTLYSKKYKPWKKETYLAFNNSKLAFSFEKYLKSGSGNAFLKKRLLPNL